MDYSSLPPTVTLKELLPLIRMSHKHAYHLLKRGRFPVQHFDSSPYKFNQANVIAYHRDGVKSNPLAHPKHSRFFRSAQKAMADQRRISPKGV